MTTPVAPPQPSMQVNANSAHMNPLPPVFTLPQTAQLEALFTIIRDKDTSRATYDGVGFEGKICGAMEAGLREVCRSVRIGKILIQRDEETTLLKLFSSKFPQDIANRYVLLLDPMLATGDSAMKVVEVLMDHGVPEERIIFINLIASLEGLKTFLSKYPQLKVITG
ncbi:PRTase-like protein [Hymenopellis radicata]|nr:PRTase-like protein [Hymenopellis radicata]